MEKLYYILKILQDADDIMPAMQIQEQLEIQYDISINVKTIYQAIKNLNDLFMLFAGKQLIETIRKRGYRIIQDYFEDGQLQYLCDTIIYNPSLSEKEAKQLIQQLKNMSSTKQLDRIHLNQPVHQSLEYDLLLNLTTIIKAIHHHHNIYFQYVSYDIENATFKEVVHENGNHENPQYYIISPYRLILRDSKYYVLGYFSKRPAKLSIYRLDRMRLVRNYHSEYVDIQDQFDMEREVNNNVNMYISGKRDQLQLLFDQTVVREMASQFGKDCQVSKQYDGRYLLKAQDVLISDGLIGWLMMLQNHVQVVLPLSLKEEMKNRIEKMFRQYK